MFQVIQPERALYIQANNCVEARDWIDILTKVSQCNRKRLSTYHPSAYLNGHWLCCKMSTDTATGCTPCTGLGESVNKRPASSTLPRVCSHSFYHICFQRSTSKHSAGYRWRQRDWEDLFPLQHIHDQTDQDARSDICQRVFSAQDFNNFNDSVSYLTPCFPLQRPVEVSLCTTVLSRRSTPALSSMTPRRPTKP